MASNIVVHNNTIDESVGGRETSRDNNKIFRRGSRHDKGRGWVWAEYLAEVDDMARAEVKIQARIGEQRKKK